MSRVTTINGIDYIAGNKCCDLEDANQQCIDKFGCPLEVIFKALEIIKQKGVDVGFFKTCQTLEEYNCLCWQDEVDVNKKLTEEEFELLKECLVNDKINKK